MKIRKRSKNGKQGILVDFNKSSIINAVEAAMRETIDGMDTKLSNEIANKIEEICLTKDIVSVEEIQDLVENLLMKSSRPDVAKKYIIYRENKFKNREVLKDSDKVLLTDSFISNYKHKNNPMGQLGQFVYYRTYSRFLPEEKRREYWWETVRRAVEYNCSLVPNTTRQEAEELYDNIFNLRQFLAGRSFWVGNTQAAKDYPMSNYNCSFEVIDNLQAFEDLFYLLMIGSGVGFRILKEDVAKLPKIRTDVEVYHKEYYEKDKNKREDNTCLTFKNNTSVKITVGDSKEGWVQSLRYFLDIISKSEFKYITSIVFDYDNVRPKGEKLKKFGGTASGHDSLKTMFVKIDNTLKNINKREQCSKVKLKSIDCLDIANIIAENVVSGGVRRSSEIGLIDVDDKECIEAKSNLYQEKDGVWTINKDIAHRQMSNNSIYYKGKPTREQLHWQISKMRYSGEPAWINGEAMNKRVPEGRKGVNPCGEILLDDKGVCNLTTINVLSFVENGVLNEEKLLRAQALSARAGYRMTCIEMELPKWNEILQRDKLIGCSLTGWQDMVNATNMTKEKQIELLKKLRKEANEVATKYANEIGQNKPLLCTTVKPEGTLSQLPTVSSGVHYSHSPYFIRRVRISSSDPLVKVCEELGYPVFPEVGQEWDTCKTKVIEFPVKAPLGKTKYDVSAIEQLENYKMFMENYVDHNCFSRNTRFITNKGVKSFEDFEAGDIVTVLNGNGNWSDAKIVKYNKENLMRINLRHTSLNNDEDNVSINSTPNHRWLVRKSGKNIIKTTSELLEGDKIVVNYLNNDNIKPSIEGIIHGIIYGDGSIYNTKKTNLKSQVYLIGEKRELTKYFEGLGTITERNDINQTRIYGLEGYLKSLPTDISDINYLMGFIMGWISTDGSVDKNGNVSISTSDESALQWLLDISTTIGLSIGEINKHKGLYESNKFNYNIPISKSTLKKEWFIRKSQINRFNDSKHHKFYSVESIEMIENNDEVWCVEEPITNQFTLEHNILTFNCSITVHVRDNEWEAVEQWIWDNWDSQIGITFLSLDDSFYQLLPYEAIDETEYNNRLSKMKPFIPSLISKYEVEEKELDLGQADCSSGACPIR